MKQLPDFIEEISDHLNKLDELQSVIFIGRDKNNTATTVGGTPMEIINSLVQVFNSSPSFLQIVETAIMMNKLQSSISSQNS